MQGFVFMSFILISLFNTRFQSHLISFHFSFFKNKVKNFTCDLLFSFWISELKNADRHAEKISQVIGSLIENIPDAHPDY